MTATKPLIGAIPERDAARQWFALSVGSLIIAGMLALLLVIARLPLIARFTGDPGFFKRCLVVHVDLSLVVWFCTFIVGQSFLLLAPGQSSKRSRYAVWVAATGVLLLLLSAAAPGAKPILANYVPVIDHWSFLLGLGVFAAGVLFAVVDRRLLPGSGPATWFELPPAAAVGLRAAVIALVLAALTFVAAYVAGAPGLAPDVAYELIHWGGGHVLQLATSAAMVATWVVLLGRALGAPPFSRGVAALFFALLTLPWLVAPLLPLAGVQDVGAREAFTQLMRFGIFPAVTLALACSLRALWRARSRVRLGDPRIAGFLASAGLTVLGYVLGALIRGSSTIVPAHYHACIGAVTVSFMALGYELLEPLALPAPRGRIADLVRSHQPLLFGIGQSVFAIGFAFAGAHGAGRKTYAAEQHVRSASEAFGLIVMAAGGMLAVVAGVSFLSFVAAAFVRPSNVGGSFQRTEDMHGRRTNQQAARLAARAR